MKEEHPQRPGVGRDDVEVRPHRPAVVLTTRDLEFGLDHRVAVGVADYRGVDDRRREPARDGLHRVLAKLLEAQACHVIPFVRSR